MGVLKPHQLLRASQSLTRPPSITITHTQLRTVAAFRNQTPGEKNTNNDALGMVGSPKKRSRANDGTVSWNNLNAGEKVIRSTQQSFNFAVIVVGSVMVMGVGYVMYTEVFSPSSKTVQFVVLFYRKFCSFFPTAQEKALCFYVIREKDANIRLVIEL